MDTPTPSDFDGSKPWWQSKTLIGLAAIVLAQILNRFHLGVLPEDVTDILTPLLTLVGAVLAVIGRVKARTTLTVGKAPAPSAEPGARPVNDPHHKGGFTKGSAQVDGLVIVAIIAWLALVCIAAAFWLDRRHHEARVRPVAYAVERYAPSRDLAVQSVSTWLATFPQPDTRPFWMRLAASLRVAFDGKVFQDETGTVRGAITKVEVNGGADF